MDHNQIFAEKDIFAELKLQNLPASVPFTTRNGETQSFSRITKPFFYYITLFGLRTFALPTEYCRIFSVSLAGIIFFVPAIATGGYYVYYMFGQFKQNMDIYSFFSGPASIFFELLLCYVYLFMYLIVSLLCTRILFQLIKALDSLTISRKSQKQFKFFFIASLLFAIVLHAFICFIMIHAYKKILTAHMQALTYIHYVTFYSIIYIVAVLIFPIAFLALFVFFLSEAFNEHLEKLRNFPKSKIEDQLPWFYIAYLELAKVLEEADKFFGCITLGIMGCALVNISTYSLNYNNTAMLPPEIVYSMIFLMVLNFLCFNFLCTCLNEKSREVESDLHEILPHNTNIYRWVDGFHRKVIDVSWGLTLGKFFLLDRAAFLGLISAMVTFVALYAQFEDQIPAGTNATATAQSLEQAIIQQSQAG